MDVQASFAKLWGERFPGEIPPSVFHEAETMNNNNTDKLTASGFRQTSDAFKHDAILALVACEKKIKTIEAELTRQRFLKDYLVKFLESEMHVSNGLSHVGVSESNHPGVNFPDPGEVKVGEVCTRVVRGKRSRVPNSNNLTEKENQLYDNRPPLRYHGKPIVPPLATTTTVEHNARAVTINKTAVQKCEGETVGYVASESQPHLEKISEADNSQSDKSTITDLPVTISNHKQPPAVKTKPKPAPLPRPKRQRNREATSSDTAVVRETELANTAQKRAPTNEVQTSGKGTGGLNSLHTAENSCVVAGKAGQPGFVSSCGDLGHDSLVVTTGRQKETRSNDSGVLSEPSKGTPSTVSKKLDKAVEVCAEKSSTLSGSKGCVKKDFPDQVSGSSVLQLARRSVSGIQVDVQPVSSQTVSTADEVCDTREDTMIRKLTHRNPSDSDSVTGLKYRPKNNYEVVELGDSSLARNSSGSDCDLLVGSPKDDPFYENSVVNTPLPPLPDVVTGNGVSDVDVSNKRMSTGPEFEDEDQGDIEEESLYETLAVGKSFHAALTAEDESFDSLSLYSDNETVRSDASVDSGVGSKASMDSHPQLVSSEQLSCNVDAKDPYAELYATVNKLKRESSPETAALTEVDTTATCAAVSTTKAEENMHQRQAREPQYEYVDIDSFQTPDTSANAPVKVSEQTVRREETRVVPVPQRHDYEECLPPGLEGQGQSSNGHSTAQVTGQRHSPPLSTDNISGSPVRLRRDHPGSRTSQNRDSQETLGSQRNSSPLSHDELDAGSSDSDGDQLGTSSSEKEKLRLRKLVLRGILETERDYLTSLEVLLKYKKSLEAAAVSSQPVISLEDVKVIFSKIPDLHSIHQKFVHELADRIGQSTPQQQVGDLFKMLISSFPVYSDYMKNYPKAVETIGRCSEENSQFRDLANMIPVPNSKETLSLQDMLFKPVVRIQRNTLVLHDLINRTPKTHPDYEELLNGKRLTHLNLEEYGDPRQNRSSRKLEEQQHLVKNSFLVAMEGGRRKLRYVFLFNDVIICTKQKISGRSQRHSFEVKWFAPLTDVLLTDHRIDQQGGDGDRESRISNMDEVEDLKKRVIALKAELRADIKKAKENEGREKSWSFASRSAAKAIEKQKKKLHELEAALVQASPNLPFKINHKSSGKSYVFLMSTDYEREEWSEAIVGNQAKVKSDLQSKPLTHYDIQMLIENVKQLPKVNRVGNALLKSTGDDDDDDGLSGVLKVTIHRLSGLTKPSDTFCCLELDSYGHFFMTARTNVCRGEKNPVWDEEFEIDLDGSQTLRILCYRRGSESEGDVLLGKSALELKTSWLEQFHETEISLNEYSLMVSIRYVTAATTMKRLPSRLKTGVFGVKITTLVRREGRKIPTVVTACVDEIEKRGMDETGIYRVSGVTSDVQRLKKAFDKNSRGAMHLLNEFDIHAVSGVLKLYFRELPEPLFTEALYCNFIDSLALADAEAKEKCMLSLLHSLPDPSLRTVLYLIDHLIRVSQHQVENRMNLHNLATIFGPTLLRPAAKDAGTPTPDMLFMGAQEALSQTAVLQYFITLRVAGKDLSKPSATKTSKLI